MNVINSRLMRDFFTVLKLVAGKDFLWNLFKTLVCKVVLKEPHKGVSLDS